MEIIIDIWVYLVGTDLVAQVLWKIRKRSSLCPSTPYHMQTRTSTSDFPAKVSQQKTYFKH